MVLSCRRKSKLTVIGLRDVDEMVVMIEKGIRKGWKNNDCFKYFLSSSSNQAKIPVP